MTNDQSKDQLNYNQDTKVPGTEQIEGLEEMKSSIVKANGLPLVKELPSKECWKEKGAMQCEFLNDSVLTKIKQQKSGPLQNIVLIISAKIPAIVVLWHFFKKLGTFVFLYQETQS